MNEIIMCILERRSIRKYRPEQISDEELNAVLEAGLYAPNAGSRQSAVIAACQNTEINDALGKINKAAFHGRFSTENSYVSKEQPSIADDVSIESAFYNAPTVLTLFAPRNFLYSCADCYAAAQNMTLAAHSLGIGSCIIARAEETFTTELGRQLQKKWNIDDGFEAKVHLALGYPAAILPQVKPRKENRIRIIQAHTMSRRPTVKHS